MVNEIDSPAVEWASLRIGGKLPDENGLPTRPWSHLGHERKIRFALTKEGFARALFPMATGERFNDVTFGKTLSLGRTVVSVDGKSVSYVDVICLERSLERVFAEVIEEMNRRIVAGTNGPVACRETAEEFARLFEPQSQQEIDNRTVRGLIGELLFLNQLLEKDPSAWAAWLGGSGNRNDFRNGASGVEVKTSGRDTQIVHISSEGQMDVEIGGQLLLVLYNLDATTNGRLGISALVNEALKLCDDTLSVRKKLSQVGCIDHDSDLWNQESFECSGMTVWRVGEGFPRIVPSSFIGDVLPAGVGNVSYRVDLAAASDFLIGSEQVDKEIDVFLEKRHP